jgi:HAD superfamily hydrolase (TIGR01458 family)
MAELPDVALALVDLDGTVYVGTRPLPGAVEAVAQLRDLGVMVRFVTNTDSITPDALVDRLQGMGIPVTTDEVLTPVVLAVQLLSELPAARLLALASRGIRDLLAGFLAAPGEPATHVLVCDPSYGTGYEELDAAFHAVRGGAELLATQVGRIARRDDGEHLDTGGFVRLLEYATGTRARVLGKPSPDFFRLALDATGVPPERAVMVGDDLAADVAGAQQVGIRAVLVRTGKASNPHAHPPSTGPGPGASTAEAAAVRPDTGVARSDTPAARPDTPVVQPDTAAVRPDTEAAGPGTRVVQTHAGATEPDAVIEGLADLPGLLR